MAFNPDDRHSRRPLHRKRMQRITRAAMHTLMDHRSGKNDISERPRRVVWMILTLRAAASYVICHHRLAKSADAMLDAWLHSRLADLLERALVDAHRRRGDTA